MILKATLSTVRNGFSYERDRIAAWDWDDLTAKLRESMERLSNENPDSVLIKLERPQ